MYKLSPSSENLTVEDLSKLYEMIEDRGATLDPEEFHEKVSLKGYLDDDEAFTRFLRTNPDAQFFNVEFNPGEFLYVIHTYGCDSLFTQQGKPINLRNNFDSLLSEEIATSPSGWLLGPYNSFYSRAEMGEEFVRFKKSDLECIDGTNGSSRLKLLVDNSPVCGIEVRDGEIKTSYTLSTEKDKGYEEALLRKAEDVFQGLDHSLVGRDDDAKKFKMKNKTSALFVLGSS